jgi:hypothetical protein
MVNAFKSNKTREIMRNPEKLGKMTIFGYFLGHFIPNNPKIPKLVFQ